MDMDPQLLPLLEQIARNSESWKSTPRPLFSDLAFWAILVASFTSLLIAGGIGKYIKPFLWIKPNLKTLKLELYSQSSLYWRLPIKNVGNQIAKDVQVEVTQVIDNGKRRSNFLAVPLRWTHLNCESRDILPSQTAYLDVIDFRNAYALIEEKGFAKIITRKSGGVDHFQSLKPGKTTLEITIFQESGGKIYSLY